MRTVKLDEIVRQRDPELKAVVEQFAVSGRRSGGLEREGRVPEVKAVTALLAAMPVLARRLPHGLLPQLAGAAYIVTNDGLTQHLLEAVVARFYRQKSFPLGLRTFRKYSRWLRNYFNMVNVSSLTRPR